MTPVLLARHAMHTRFELVLYGAPEASLRAAGEEALEEIERLENQLSLFRPTSEIARVNRHADTQPVRVSSPTFRLLARAQELSRQTGGAFDPTIGPLLRAWGFLGGSGALPDPGTVREARDRVGMDKVTLCEEDCTVRFERPGMMLDLGAIGKGYAVDCAVNVLREAGVTSAFVHGGTSSVYGLGTMPDGQPWKVAIPAPEEAGEGTLPGGARLVTSQPARNPDEARRQPRPTGANDSQWVHTESGVTPSRSSIPLAEMTLTNTGLGVSAVSGKAFRSGGRCFGHVLDPRTGEPVQRAWLAAISAPGATEADALSTALLVLGDPGRMKLVGADPGLRAWLVPWEPGGRGGA